MPTEIAVVCKDVQRSYQLDGGGSAGRHGPEGNLIPALRGVTLSLPRGSFTALMGPSGSGKSTLLRLLACIDRADAGSVQIDGTDVTRLSRARRVRLRRKRLGFMFQAPPDNLLEYLTVRQHLQLGARMRGLSKRDPQIDELLDALGLASRAKHLPKQLSGGEQQRVAIAFAAVGPPALLVADEPTGQLDHSTVDSVLAAFAVLATRGVAVVAATHDPTVARSADRVVRMRDGRIEEEEPWR
jgi:putative ABC transport system ATP-binding protein